MNESSARLMGSAFAGTAALAEDATTGYFNVAGLTRIRQGSVAGTVTGYLLNLDFHAASAAVAGQPVAGERNVDPTRNVAVPSFHAAWRLSDRWVAGFGVTVPFGLETKYPADSVVRFVATKSEVVTYNLNPMIAYRINRQWSIGAGFNAQYLKAKLEQKIFLGATRPEGDLFATLSDWSWGANAGILFEPTDDMRFGVNYRSQISYSLIGPVKLANIPIFKNGNVAADLTVPDTVTLSGLVTALPGLQLLGDLSWIHWNVFKELRGTFNNGLPPFVVVQNFHDVWRASLGFNYDLTARWSVRMGGAYDQSPVTDANRTVRIPDSDRWFLGAGVGYRLTDGLVVDFGYLHIFFAGGTVDQTAQQPGAPTIRGTYDNGTGDLLALQVAYNFDHLLDAYDQLAQRFQ